MSKIRTNKVIPSFCYDEIDRHYDIFCLETSKKYFDRGAKIIDAPLMKKDVKAVLFETGRRFYVLLNHNSDNLPTLKSLLSDSEYGASVSISQKSSSSLNETQVKEISFVPTIGTPNIPDLLIFSPKRIAFSGTKRIVSKSLFTSYKTPTFGNCCSCKIRRWNRISCSFSFVCCPFF